MPATPPPEPLSVDEVKLNLRVTSDDEDSLIFGLIVAAREHVENETDLVLTPRLVTETVDQLGRSIALRSWPIMEYGPIRAPVNDDMVTVPVQYWRGTSAQRPARIIPVSTGWGPGYYPAASCGSASLPVEIDVFAGYATPEDIPAAVRQAIHLLVAHWYTNRSAAEVGARAAAVEIPMGVDALLDRYRLRSV